jgi:Protein of unknown function (DUF3455)
MYTRVKFLELVPVVLAIFGSVALTGCGAAPDGSASAGEAVGEVSTPESEALAFRSVPTLPSPTLAVPAGNRVAFHYDAIGVQIYACQATATGYGWVFTAPEATLYGIFGRTTGKHYAGPTWESKDGSKVVGSKLAAFTADPTAIPELLLQAVSHDGDGRMAKVTYVQRLDTVGGLAPTTGCDASSVGAVARSDYTATYYFYKPAFHFVCDAQD